MRGMAVYSRHGGELIVAEHSSSSAAVRAALKAFDRNLILTWEREEKYQTDVWNVHLVTSNDHPAHFICSWRENGTGRPLPLTSSLVDEVKRLREVDTLKLIDAHNAKLRAALVKEERDGALAVAADHKPYIDRGRVLQPRHRGPDGKYT